MLCLVHKNIMSLQYMSTSHIDFERRDVYEVLWGSDSTWIFFLT